MAEQTPDRLTRINDLSGRIGELTADELAELGNLLADEIDAAASAEPTDEILGHINTVADAAEQVAAERTRRDEVAAEQTARRDEALGRAQAARERIAPPAAAVEQAPEARAEGDPAPAETAEQREAVAASAKPKPIRISQVVASAAGRRDPERERPDDPQSDGRVRASLTAGGTPTGPALDAQTFTESWAQRLDSLRHTPPSSDGTRVVVASARWDYPEANDLRHRDADMVTERMDNVVTPMVASGGICRPVNVDYAIPTWANLERPVRDSLPSFQATRGGIHYVVPTPFDMSVFGPAVGIWTNANDINPGGPGTGVNSTRTVTDGVTVVGTTLTSATAAFTFADVGRSVAGGSIPAGATIVSVQSGTSVTLSAAGAAAATGVTVAISGVGTGPTVKPCIEMNCGTEMEVLVEAITQCVTISNFRARFNPEQVANFLQYVGQAWAVTAEIELLRQMRAFAKHVSGTQLFGFARDSLVTLSLINAYFRDKYRMSQNTMLRVVLKRWVKDAVRADLTKAAFPYEGGDGYNSLSVPDAAINQWFADRNMVVTWALDSDVADQNFTNQAPGTVANPATLVGFPAVTRMLVYPEGTYQFLDGGQLDLGVVRDSTLNAVNKFQIFSESFEGVAPRGFEALDFSAVFRVNGAAAGTVAPA